MQKLKWNFCLSLCWLILNSCMTRVIDYTAIAERNFRQDMHHLVISLAEYATSRSPGFIIIPQNGHELLLDNGKSPLRDAYLAAIDGVAQESLWYGYPAMNQATPTDSHDYLLHLLGIGRQAGKKVLVIDYCNRQPLVDDSYASNSGQAFISFAASVRELTVLPGYPPEPFHRNQEAVSALDQARNFLYILNYENFTGKTSLLNAIKATDYDLVVLDLFFEDQPFTGEELAALKVKANGGSRLVIGYLSIGEAEDYRFYWQKSWKWQPPLWLDRENPDWKGNYKVRYWEKEWQDLLLFGEDSYLNRIISAGFDGVYLDIIDAYEYFEEVTGQG